ncbi:hypothetical protein [Brevundimonas sp. CEF1]|uniref:hypothetical protein n=1 Tax=Brevundimonas sp. CEF1 TaxID=3442642 RepID=UPI003F519B85
MIEKTSYEIRPEGQALLRGVFSDPQKAADAAQAQANEAGVAYVITEVVVAKTTREFGRFEPASV